jgi:alpha-L-fucosidase
MLLFLGLAQAGLNLAAASPPQPYGPVPTERQLLWHDLEFYGFVHFTVNTFTDKEWGFGDESEQVFNPTAFDADQIARAAKMGGMKGLVLTCKHHDGFCLWPSQYTEHSVKNSPWKGGKGDVVRELSDACRREGLKFGVYLSPWDRNHKDYGTPAYITYYRQQLRELLTNYGELFTVWFDGANGGDGFYGGARETRRIDNRVFYDWPNTWKLVRELQPNACMFSDGGPDFRWVGNESGIGGEPCWATINGAGRYPGGASEGLNSGERPGTDWVPAECDVSIRPGWFYHAQEDSAVKSPAHLLEIYYASVGRGCCLNLNLPPDRRGQVHENDLASLREFRRILDATFATNFAQNARLEASQTRGGDDRFAAANLVDGKRTTYWSTDDAVKTPELVVDLGRPVTFNVVRLREYLPLGQRVDAFALDAWVAGQWQEFFRGTSIGNQRLARTEYKTASRLRLRITKAAACPALSELGVFAEPLQQRGPNVRRNPQGMVTLQADGPGPQIRYTLDGSQPGPKSPLYEKPFPLPDGGIVNAQSSLPDGSSASAVASVALGVSKTHWKVVTCSNWDGGKGKAEFAIDENSSTIWRTPGKTGEHAEEIVVDMGATNQLTGFSYLPPLQGAANGIVSQYQFYTSLDGQSWGDPAAAGEIGNIKANRQLVVNKFGKTLKARYWRFVALRAVEGDTTAVAEIGVISY